MQLTGRYNAKLDDKGRLSLPARLRNALAAEQVVVLPGLEGKQLLVMTEKYFEEKITGPILSSPMAVLDKTKRNLLRFFTSSANTLDIDSSGRINIPKDLRDRFSLPAKGEAVIVGMGVYLEIWNPYVLAEDEASAPDMALLAQQVYNGAV